jgi:hypothetical protein
MHWIDWLIVCNPLIVVLGIGLKSQKYIKGVSDFLTVGRVAGRYLVCDQRRGCVWRNEIMILNLYGEKN